MTKSEIKQHSIDFFAWCVDNYVVVGAWELRDPHTDEEISTDKAYDKFKRENP